MFEQSMVDAPRRKPWTFSVATAFQVSLVGAAFLVPLLRIEALPPVNLAACRCTPPPKGVQIVDTRPVRAAQPRTGSAAIRIARVYDPVLAAPRTIPRGIPQLIEEGVPVVEPGAGGASAAFGVPNGIVGANYSGPPSVSPPAVARKPEAPPVAKPSKPPVYRTTGGQVRPPRLIREVRPVYPHLARQARIAGTVKIEAVLTTEGTVQALRTVSGHPLLFQAALDAVRQWRYEPTLLNGEPVEVALSIEVNFTLTQ